jgi:hypothetical protein
MAIQRGMYDLALSTASQGGVAMKEIFVSLATRCVELAMSVPLQYVNASSQGSPLTQQPGSDLVPPPQPVDQPSAWLGRCISAALPRDCAQAIRFGRYALRLSHSGGGGLFLAQQQ